MVQIVDKDFQVVSKTIKQIPKDVPRMVHEQVGKLKDLYGQSFEPLGFLFGPSEYFLLCEFIDKNPFYDKRVMIRYPDEFMGYRIELKLSNGIEPIYPKDMVMILAKGTVTT